MDDSHEDSCPSGCTQASKTVLVLTHLLSNLILILIATETLLVIINPHFKEKENGAQSNKQMRKPTLESVDTKPTLLSLYLCNYHGS